MPAYVSLKNRIPEIMAVSLPERTAVLTMAVGEVIAEGAKARAPVETGRLRDSIEARPRGKSRLNSAVAVVALFYWFFQEFGTKNQGAHPFMIPAAEEARLAVNRLAHEAYLAL